MDRQLKRELEGIVARIGGLEPRFEAMSDGDLRAMTAGLRNRHERGETLDGLLVEAFAAVREASKRTLGLRHFDVQLMGGIVLHRGMIAEMRAGEGKTLVSTLAGYLNALDGRGVHVVTVNDYLARRDSEWMGEVYRFLGMSVGLIQSQMEGAKRGPQYQADVTYGTSSELGFDYLRDNMVTQPGLRVQRGHAFAIVDDADSILIDGARTPLIISGAGTGSADTYKRFARAVRGLREGVDFEMDEAKGAIHATEMGELMISRSLGLGDLHSDPSGLLANHLWQALRAQYLFHRDRQYVVVGGEVKIVDGLTGRAMEGRRYSEGLHQAIEAKEGVPVREERQTLATIALRNYFRLYEKLSGMTGTALAAKDEFREIYNLPVQAIPTNRPMIRIDHDDLVYRSVEAKLNAVADDVAARNWRRQPVLVGTTTVEASEELSRLLKGRGIGHKVLNAKDPEREAAIVAEAGRAGAVTIATSMAGRGTDIPLGGSRDHYVRERCRELGVEDPEDALDWQAEQAGQYARRMTERERAAVIEAGGLCVIGTERHESRRIDDQLRGRSGRQGDPGETQFYLSLDDDLGRLLGGDRIAAMMARYDMPEDMPTQARMVTKAVERGQRKVKEMTFALRKNALDYDDVMDRQRQVIYEERNKILDGGPVDVYAVISDTVTRTISGFDLEERWGLVDLQKWAKGLTGRTNMPRIKSSTNVDNVSDQVEEYLRHCYEEVMRPLPDEQQQPVVASTMLRIINKCWAAHLQALNHLQADIRSRKLDNEEALREYETEAQSALHKLRDTINEDLLRTILRIEIAAGGEGDLPSAASRPEGSEGRPSAGPEEGPRPRKVHDRKRRFRFRRPSAGPEEGPRPGREGGASGEPPAAGGRGDEAAGQAPGLDATPTPDDI